MKIKEVNSKNLHISACLNLNYGICNKTETKNVKVAKMVEFIKTCDQHSRSLTLVIFLASYSFPLSAGEK